MMTSEQQAELSKKENRVVPHRFFWPMKPMMGVRKGEPFTIERFLEFIKEYPVFLNKKYDGVNVEIHRTTDRLTVYTDNGKNITKKLPERVLEPFKKVKEDYVILAELESWENGVHRDRETTAGDINAGRDAHYVFNIYDIVYWQGKDIHKEPLSARLEFLQEFQKALPKDSWESSIEAPEKSINFAPYEIATSRNELIRLTKKISSSPGAEGVIAKFMEKPYSLSGGKDESVKYRVTDTANVVVIKPIETKTKGVFNYLIGFPTRYQDKFKDELVRAGKYKVIVSGKTFSTKERYQPGDFITIEYTTLNIVTDEEGREIGTMWLPRIIGRAKSPDYMEDVIARAREKKLAHEKTIKTKSIWEPKKVSQYSDEGLLAAHWEIHRLWGSLKARGWYEPPMDLLARHKLIADEMKKRHFQHRIVSEIDAPTQFEHKILDELDFGKGTNIPIHPSSSQQRREPIYLDEFLDTCPRKIVLGCQVWQHKEQLNYIVTGVPPDPATITPIAFRLQRAEPPEIAQHISVQFRNLAEDELDDYELRYNGFAIFLDTSTITLGAYRRKGFTVIHHWLIAVGAIVNQGLTEHDIDILVRSCILNDEVIEAFSNRLPEYIKSRLHFLPDIYSGPFTCYRPLYEFRFELPETEIPQIAFSLEELRELVT